jgi:Periplasmic copper-binding protein (NosD)
MSLGGLADNRFRAYGRLFAAGLIGFVLLAVLTSGYACAQSCPVTITSCGCTIDAPGRYTVAAPLTGASGRDCIVVDTHHVVLDLNGEQISGPGDFAEIGIHVEPQAHHIRIKGQGAAISGFAAGLEIDKARNVFADHLVTHDNGDGVCLYRTRLVHLSHCRSSSNFNSGAVLSGGSDNTLEDVTATGNCEGISFDSSSHNRIASFSVESNILNGIRVGKNIVFGEEPGCEQHARAGSGLSGESLATVCVCFGVPSLACVECGCTGPAAVGNLLTGGRARDNGVYGIELGAGSHSNAAKGNAAIDNSKRDLFDSNLDCDNDRWQRDTFVTSNQDCIH